MRRGGLTAMRLFSGRRALFCLSIILAGLIRCRSNDWIFGDDDDYVRSGTMKLYFTSETDELAVCNDGTSGAYYYAPSINDTYGGNRWIIYLTQGGQCYNQNSCSARSGNYISSSGYNETMTFEDSGGLFAPALKYSNAWAFNRVYIPYCSSDIWIGDASAWGKQFRGQRIIRAVLTQLVDKGELTSGSEILFAGNPHF
jgi:Pectinacetylesterase